MSDGPETRWLTPGTLFGALGMVAAIFAAWMTFESRITKVENGYETTGARLDRIENKLDRIIERGMGE